MTQHRIEKIFCLKDHVDTVARVKIYSIKLFVDCVEKTLDDIDTFLKR